MRKRLSTRVQATTNLYTREVEKRVVGRAQTQTRHVDQMQFVAESRVFVVVIHVSVIEHFDGVLGIKLANGVAL